MGKLIKFLFFGMALCFLSAPTRCFAQAGDMWTAYAEKTGAYSPHVNNCSSTEVFIAIGGSPLGFCMEKDERSSAEWTDAKDDCAADGKRLPEPAEFKFACRNPPTGLVNMTNSYEWTSNHAVPMHQSTGNYDAIIVSLMGNGSCNYGAWAAMGISNSAGYTFAYRCVR